MNEENLPSTVASQTTSSEATTSSASGDVQRHWHGVVKRRSFLKGLGVAGATLSAGALLTTQGNAQAEASKGKLRRAIPRFCGSQQQRN
jgi:TAT (twin-arginine translocation) pathway signal sequence